MTISEAPKVRKKALLRQLLTTVVGGVPALSRGMAVKDHTIHCWLRARQGWCNARHERKLWAFFGLSGAEEITHLEADPRWRPPGAAAVPPGAVPAQLADQLQELLLGLSYCMQLGPEEWSHICRQVSILARHLVGKYGHTTSAADLQRAMRELQNALTTILAAHESTKKVSKIAP